MNKKFFLISFILVLLDQVVKNLVIGKKIDLFLFKINYATNTGALFGILKGQNVWLIYLSILIIILIFVYLSRYEELYWPLLFLLSGATGNLIDRVVNGFVIDFIDLGFFYIFNLADVYNTIGIILLLLGIFNIRFNPSTFRYKI